MPLCRSDGPIHPRLKINFSRPSPSVSTNLVATSILEALCDGTVLPCASFDNIVIPSLRHSAVFASRPHLPQRAGVRLCLPPPRSPFSNDRTLPSLRLPLRPLLVSFSRSSVDRRTFPYAAVSLPVRALPLLSVCVFSVCIFLSSFIVVSSSTEPQRPSVAVPGPVRSSPLFHSPSPFVVAILRRHSASPS